MENKEGFDVKIKCERCGSGYGYVRLKSNLWVCRSCSFIMKIGNKKGDKKDASDK